jgi:serine/threonine-protein kinase
MTAASSVGAAFAKQVFCRVPKVKGKKLSRAKRALRKAHCRPGKIRHRASRKFRKGRVISQKPGAHRRLHQGAKVRLVVSKGKPLPKHRH